MEQIGRLRPKAPLKWEKLSDHAHNAAILVRCSINMRPHRLSIG